MLQKVSPADTPMPGFTGILLAAGKGTRFDVSGTHNKLLQPLANGSAVVVASARNLLAVLPDVLAVIRPGNEEIASRLQEAGCKVTICQNADDGIAVSLVYALAHSPQARGWVIALADMPYVQPETVQALVAAMAHGAQIAVPLYQERRGNPVAFSRMYLNDLMRLRGDEGARHLLKSLPVTEVATNDPGITQDIDTLADLHVKMSQDRIE